MHQIVPRLYIYIYILYSFWAIFKCFQEPKIAESYRPIIVAPVEGCILLGLLPHLPAPLTLPPSLPSPSWFDQRSYTENVVLISLLEVCQEWKILYGGTWRTWQVPAKRLVGHDHSSCQGGFYFTPKENTLKVLY